MKATREQVEEIFENDETSWDGDNCFQGMQIIAKYTDNVVCGADHDIVYSADLDDLIEAGLTIEDANELRKLNWMLEDNDYLSCFV
jgi:hypothetical protein